VATLTLDEAERLGLSLDSHVTSDVQKIVEAAQQFAAEIASGDVLVRGQASLAGTIPNSTWYNPAVTELAEEITPERIQQTFQQARLGNQTAVMDIVYLSAMIDPTRQPEAQVALSNFAAEIVGLNNSGAITIDALPLSIIERIAPAGQAPAEPAPVALSVGEQYYNVVMGRQDRLALDAERTLQSPDYRNSNITVSGLSSNYTADEVSQLTTLAANGYEPALTDLMLIRGANDFSQTPNPEVTAQIEAAYNSALAGYNAGEYGFSESSVSFIQTELAGLNRTEPLYQPSPSQLAFQERQSRIAADTEITTNFDPTYVNPSIVLATTSLGNYTQAELDGINARARIGDPEAITEATTIVAVLGGETDVPEGPATDLVVTLGAVLQANENGEAGISLPTQQIQTIEASIASLYEVTDIEVRVGEMDPERVYGAEYLQAHHSNGNMYGSLDALVEEGTADYRIELPADASDYDIARAAQSERVLRDATLTRRDADDVNPDVVLTTEVGNYTAADFTTMVALTGAGNENAYLEAAYAQAQIQGGQAVTDEPVQQVATIVMDGYGEALRAADAGEIEITDAHYDGMALNTHIAIVVPEIAAIVMDPETTNAGALHIQGMVADESLFTPRAAPAPLTPPAPDEAPAVITSAPDVSVITVEFNAVTNVADANVLLNGVANDDMAHIRQVIEEARAMGVDPALIDRVEGQINDDIAQFVTTQSATAATIAYSSSLQEALANDGIVSEAEYAGALSSYFTQISTGIVEDRVGLRDDIAAEAGMDVAAREFMSQIREAVALSGVAPSAPPPAPETIRYASMNM